MRAGPPPDYLRHYRLTLLMKCEGLDPGQLARRSVPPSTMSLLGYPDLGTRLGRKGIAVREMWVHRIEEYARHCGHADLLRERIDGQVGQ